MPELTLVAPAHLWVPEHTSTSGGEAADLAESAGLVLDAEQRLVLDSVLAENGARWAALEAAVVEARQNGKTVALQALALAGLYMFGEDLIIWSAHLFGTAQEAFRDLCALIDGAPHLSRRVKRISAANGEEGIELVGGQRIQFKARTKTGGRGLSGKRVILDEAFALGASEMGSLLPTLSAQENPQVVYGSSAGLVGSGILRALRDRGRKGGDPSLVYVEWCAPEGGCAMDHCDHAVGRPGCVADDPEMWRQANPAIERGRITVEYVAAERRALPPDEFCRERLGWWDDPAPGDDGVPLERWALCATPEGVLADPVVFAVDVAPGNAWASIVACGGPVEVVEHRRGSAWLVDRLVELRDSQSPVGVGLDPAGPAGALLPDLERAGFEFRSKEKPSGLLVAVSGRDMVNACGGLYAAVLEGTFSHRDQPVLNDAVAGAGRRQVGDAWKWSRRDSSVDISPLVAATVAAYLWSQPKPTREFFGAWA